MQPGDLDQRITLRSQTSVDDGYGGTILGDYADRATAWASVEPLKGSEAIANMQVTGKQTYRLWMRDSVSVSTSDRVVWQGRTMEVRECPPPRRNGYRQVVVEEIEP